MDALSCAHRRGGKREANSSEREILIKKLNVMTKSMKERTFLTLLWLVSSLIMSVFGLWVDPTLQKEFQEMIDLALKLDEEENPEEDEEKKEETKKKS